jgi:asparagine synthase (glutamine-hydrolysing)
MNGFQVFIDFEKGTLALEGSDRAREPHPSGLILAADARLDNRQELLDALAGELSGAPGNADLILAAYLKWGERCPEHLLGDFAFVVWDPKHRRIFGARDQLGVRPFHYAQTGSLLCLASQAYQILRHPEVPRRLNLVSVGCYLLDLTSEPSRTFFESVLQLPPGHSLSVTSRGQWVHRYWDIDLSKKTVYRNEGDYACHFLEIFRQAVRDRLTTPGGRFGVSMSGGLDSTSVAAVATQELDGRNKSPLLACSFTFKQLRECDESFYVKSLSEALGIETAFIDAESFWLLGSEEAYVPSLDTPIMYWDAAFQQMLRVLEEKHYNVLLTGHGADDLLLGSHLVYADRLRRGDLHAIGEVWNYSRSRRYGWRPLYKFLIEPLLGSSTTEALRHILGRHRTGQAVPDWIAPDFARRTGLIERITEDQRLQKGSTALDQMYEHLILRPGYLNAVEWFDRISAPFQIEVRHPFLDRRLFELIFSIPPDQLFRCGERKPLLRTALTGVLPDLVRLRRQKTHLGSFVDFSLRQKESERIRALFASPISSKLGILEGESLRQAFERYCTSEPNETQRSLWCAVTLEIWLRRHLCEFDTTTLEKSASSLPQAA